METEDYLGKINIAGALYQFESAKQTLVGYPDLSARIAIKDFEDHGDFLRGFYLHWDKKIVSSQEHVSSLHQGEYRQVILPKKLLKPAGEISQQEIGFINDMAIFRNLGTLLIDERLNRVLKGQSPRYLIGNHAYDFEVSSRSLVSIHDHIKEITLPENSGLKIGGVVYFHFDQDRLRLRPINPEDNTFPNEPHLLAVPATLDPFSNYSKSEGQREVLLRMLGTALPLSELSVFPRTHLSRLITEMNTEKQQQFLAGEFEKLNQPSRLELPGLDLSDRLRAWFSEGGSANQIILGARMFHADFGRKCFTDNLNPENQIAFREFEHSGKNEARIMMHTDSGLQVKNKEHVFSPFVKAISIPRVLFDQECWERPDMLQRINEEYKGRNFYLPDENFFSRVITGTKPLVDLAGDSWQVDGQRQELINLTQPWIKMDGADMYQENGEEEFTIVYNRITKRDDGAELEKGTVLRNEWTVLKCPPFYRLDPFGYALAEQKNPLELISRYGLASNQVARVVPIKETDIRDIINDNRKSAGLGPLKKDRTEKKKGNVKRKGI